MPTRLIRSTRVQITSAKLRATTPRGGRGGTGGGAGTPPVDPGPPGAPQNFTATLQGAQTLLQWTAPITGSPVSTYNVYRRLNAGSFVLYASGIVGLTYTDTSLIAGTLGYKVAAVDAQAREGTHSSIQSVVYTVDPGAPGPPQNFTATLHPTIARAALQWTAPVTGSPVVTYRVYRQLNGGAFSFLASVASPTLTYTDTAMFAGVSHGYRVTGTDSSAREGVPSTTQSVTLPNVPSAPQTFSVVFDGVDVLLDWTTPASGAPPVSYKVYRQVNGSAFVLWSSGVTPTDYVDTGPVNGTLGYRVTGVDAYGREGAATATMSVDWGQFGVTLVTSVTGAGVSANDPFNPLTDDWDIDNFSSPFQTAAYRKGSGWQTYKDKVIARYPAAATQMYGAQPDFPGGLPAIGETATHITFSGTAAIHFLSLFDRVIFIHGCPPKVCQRIKTASQVGTKIGLWTWTNWISTVPYYSGFTEPPREWMRTHGPGHATNPVTGPDASHFDWGSSYTTFQATTVAIANGGSGYVAGNVVTLTGGVFTAATTVLVTSVSAGVITGVSIDRKGMYSTAPTNPVAQGSVAISVSNGNPQSGATGATFTMGAYAGTARKTVDPFQGNHWGPKPGVIQTPWTQGARYVSSGHLWFWDTTSAFARQGLADTFASMYTGYWKLNLPSIDFIHSDNFPYTILGNHPYLTPNGGTRTWATVHSNWSDLANKCGVAMAAAGYSLPYLSANCGGHGAGDANYEAAAASALKLQYWEHSFMKGDSYRYYTQAEILAGVTASIASPVVEVYIGSRRSDLEDEQGLDVGEPLSSGQTYVGIPQFQDADHADLRAIRTLLGSRTNYYLMFHSTGGINQKGTAVLYHGPTVRPII